MGNSDKRSKSRNNTKRKRRFSKKPVYGTEINLRDSNGNTALFYAQEKNDRGLVRALKAAKAEL